MANEILIDSEDAAWEHLETAMAGNLSVGDDITVRFEGWPNLSIDLDAGQASMTPTMMRAFVEFQKSLYRAYAIHNYGTPNINKLSHDEKEGLEFTVRVKKGKLKVRN